VIGNVVRIAGKDLGLLWADKFGLFWVLVFPLIMAPLFGSIFGGEGPPGAMSIAVVDLDNSPGSRRFVALLEESDALRVWRPTDSETGEAVDMTEAMARDAVRRGGLTAFLVIPAGYAGDGIFGGFGAALRVGIDPSRRAEAGYLQGLIMEAAFRRLRDVFTDREAAVAEIEILIAGIDSWDLDTAQRTETRAFFGAWKDFMRNTELLADGAVGAGAPDQEDRAEQEGGTDDTGFAPVRLEMEEIVREGAGPRSAFEVSFPQAMIWGVIGSCATFAVTLVRERREGTLLRLRIAPHPIGVILAGKALACFITCVGSLALLTAIGHLVFGMRIESYPLYTLGIVCIGLCFVGIMMAIATIGTTEEAVGGAGWGVLLILTMIGGGMVPLLFMPPWLVTISKLSPVRWSVWSMEGAIWRGLGFGQLLPAYAVLIGVGLVAFMFGVRVFRKRED
jgi:ABC-2 type transport system permease protein